MNQAIKENKEPGKLYKGHFPLADSPAAIQFTVHINNMLNTGDKTTTIKVIKAMLYTNDLTQWGTTKRTPEFRFKQLIEYYGIDYCRNWFNEIYGWEFKKEAS